MTFELSSDQQAARARAHDFARNTVQPRASEIDGTATVPEALAHEAAQILSYSHDPLAKLIAVEEIAAVNAAVALNAAAAAPGDALRLSGLRGLGALERSSRTQLMLAAAALGLGRAAIEQALTDLRQATGPGKDGDKPHWVVADAATELEAARLLTYRAARVAGGEDGDAAIAMARLLATSAAQHAVDAALRLAGADALREGALLERLTRDVRAVALVMGTEEEQRATAAGILGE